MDTLLATARRGHPGLYWMAVGMAGLAVGILVVSLLDPRELLGAPLWLKPLKFAISFVAYGMALAWMLGRLPGRALQRTGWAIVAGSVIEMVIIAGQAARGQLSHFNTTDALGGLLFQIMGATVGVMYLMTAVIAVRFLRERSIEPDLATGIRIGLGVTLVGMAIGGVMAGIGSHAVGVPDGGPGLPLVGWSTTGGDLRISHFIGLHALQLLPLAAGALARFAPGLDQAVRVRVVRVLGVGYLGLVLVLTWQALRGQPLLAPDATTLAAVAALALATAGALRAVLPRRLAGAVPMTPVVAATRR